MQELWLRFELQHGLTAHQTLSNRDPGTLREESVLHSVFTSSVELALTAESELPRRRERLTIDPPEPERLDRVVFARHDPAEIRFYIKQLKKAIRYLPLGSRAYYAVSGELLKATKELDGILPAGASSKSPTQ